MNESYRKINKMLLLVVIVLSYGFLLFNPIIGIDDENFDFYFKYDGLLMSGRWGYYLLKRVLPTYEYLPVWRDTLALLVLIVAMFLTIDCIDKAFNRKLPDVVVNAVFLTGISYPIMTRMFVYIDNSLEMNMAFLCGILGYVIISSKNIGLLWMGLPILILGNAVNENCSIFFCIFVCLMIYFDEKYSKSTFLKMFKNALPYAITLGIALICCSQIGHILAASKGVSYRSSYATDSYIAWGKENLSVVLSNFLSGFSANMSHYFNKYFSVKIFVAAIIIWLLEALFCITKKRLNQTIAIMGVIIFSLSMYIITANGNLPLRIFSTNLLIVSTTFIILYDVLQKTISNVKIGRWIYFLLIFYVIFFSSKESNELYQLDHLRYQKDLDIAANINYDLIHYNKGNPQIPVVFLGGGSLYSDIEAEGELALISIYASNLKGKSIRIHRFFAMHGYNYPNVLQEDITTENYKDFLNNSLIEKAMVYANNMPSYPSDGYIEILDDMIIVKLSEYETE